jgi:hypothetical protein
MHVRSMTAAAISTVQFPAYWLLLDGDVCLGAFVAKSKRPWWAHRSARTRDHPPPIPKARLNFTRVAPQWVKWLDCLPLTPRGTPELLSSRGRMRGDAFVDSTASIQSRTQQRQR